MLTLYLYPELFGLPDNNPFGLKVDTFLRLNKLDYQVDHIIDTQNASRKQLPYLTDGKTVISDSQRIIEYLIMHYHLSIDDVMTPQQKNLSTLVNRMLGEHLYWIMSYSRWQDPQYWPLFKAEFLQHPIGLTAPLLEKAREYNIEKYYSQGIGRYQAAEIYQAGI